MVEVIKKGKKSEPVIEIKGKSVEEKQQVKEEPIKQEVVKPKELQLQDKKVDKQPQPTKKEAKFCFRKYTGQKLIFQSKSDIIIEGTVENEEYGFIKIVDAVITGRNWKSKVHWVCIDRQQIAHFHSEVIERISILSEIG